MLIDFESEARDITSKLKQVEGYLDCEKIVIHNIKRQLDNGISDESIIQYQRKLALYLDKNIKGSQGNEDCSNYRYAIAFINTLLKMPYWKIWMKTIDI